MIEEELSEKKQGLLDGHKKEVMENKTSKRAVKSLEKYRKKLLAQVVTIFLICLIVILERVFYQIIVESEEKTLSKLQQKTDLISTSETGSVQAEGITNNFFKFFGSLSEFPIQFLLLTHLMVTCYVSFDALLATKITYVSMFTIYLISVLQMFYASPRPFWNDSTILSSRCLQSYNHPSLGLILLTFVPCYAYYCYQKQANKQYERKVWHVVLMGVFVFVVLGVQFLNYLIGTMYIINIGMSLVISVLILMVVIAANSIITELIKKVTVLKIDAKKYVFYWLLFICLLATFILIVFAGEDLFTDIDWVDNFMSCTRYQEYKDKSYRYDEIIGPWFNFTQTSTLFGWIGAVFGVSAAFRSINTIEWAGGDMKKRIFRGLIGNIFVLPSWVFILWIQENGSWIKDMGLNTFIINSIHFFILYLWVFGYMPILLLHRWLKITNKEDEDFYVIVEDSFIKG